MFVGSVWYHVNMSLVSIIIPAFNAERTIAATIRSARMQTHGAVEIIVIDDGSSDRTPAIVAGLAAQDARIRLVSQANAGVAAARNRGIAEAKGIYIAPLDADDVWHPEKIERQVAALDGQPGDVALAYNWFRRIDEHDGVEPGSPHPRIEGWVFHRHVAWNFISNGSTPLIRANALADIRYDPALHDAGNQGCEDYLLQLQLARRYRFLCVPGYLTGYRKQAGVMSADAGRMIRSHMQMYEMIMASAPLSADEVVRREMARLGIELARNRLKRRDWRGARKALSGALRAQPAAAGRTLLREIGDARAAGPETSRPAAGQKRASFWSFGPEEEDGSWATRRSPEYLSLLKRLDDELHG